MTGEELLKIRKARNWTQPKMAAELGVTVTTLWRWEKGASPISVMAEKSIERLASETSEQAAA